MTRLFLVRHGPTHAKCFVGWSDMPADLSDTDALGRLSEALPADAPIVSSDLRRAIATADAIQGMRKRLPHQRRLREMHFGAWELKNFAAVDAMDSDRARAFWERPGTVAPPGGESWNALGQRIDNAVDRLLVDHPAQLIITAHIGVILSQVQRATGQAPEDVIAQKIDNLSMTEIRIENGQWHLERINHCP